MKTNEKICIEWDFSVKSRLFLGKRTIKDKKKGT
jgi:hypothetical protein